MAGRRHAADLPTPPSHAYVDSSVAASLQHDGFASNPNFQLDNAYGSAPSVVIDPSAYNVIDYPANSKQSVDGLRQDASRATAAGAPALSAKERGASRRASSAKQNHMRPQTGQAAITQKRGDSVTEQFGMITPPDGVSVHSADVDPSKSRQTEAKQASDKSESARRAANKRHAKDKSRKASVEVVDDAQNDAQNDDEEKKEQYREKNKIAAAKCRNKKRRYNDEIETQARQLETRNKALKAELMDLRNVVILLKDQILKHSPQDCGCTRLHEYSMAQAAKMLQNSHRPSEDVVATQFSRSANPPARHSSIVNGPSPVEASQASGRMWGSLSDHMASVTMGSDMANIMAGSEMQRRAMFSNQYDGFQPQFVTGDDLHSGPSSVVSPVGMPGFQHSGEFVSPGINNDVFRGDPFEEQWDFMQ